MLDRYVVLSWEGRDSGWWWAEGRSERAKEAVGLLVAATVGVDGARKSSSKKRKTRLKENAREPAVGAAGLP